MPAPEETQSTVDKLLEGSRKEEPPNRELTEEEEFEAVSHEDDDVDPERKLYIDMYFAFHEKDIAELDTAYRNLKELPDRQWTDEELDSQYADFKIKLGDTSAVDQLKQFEAEHNDWSLPSLHLARFYESVEILDQALAHIDTGLERTKADIRRTVDFTIVKARLLSKAGEGRQARGSLYELANNVTDKDLQGQIYDALADLYEQLDDKIRMQLALEQGLLLEPEDKGRRFRLAYSYGEAKETKALAVYHYFVLLQKIVRF